MKKIILGVVVVVILVGAGYWISKGTSSIFPLSQGEKAEGDASSVSAGDQTTAEGVPSVRQAAAEFASAPLTETYINDDFGFGLKYPVSLTQTDISADESSGGDSTGSPQGGDTILFDNGFGVGFQIIVSPFTEPDADITPERIKADIPDMVIKNPQEVNLGAGRGKGTTFLDGDPTKPDTNRQIWFAGNGYLFQITALPVFDTAMQRILATWTFR